MYNNGYGVPQDNHTASNWYTQAAEQGYAEAQYALGYMYNNGYGVPENDKTAFNWYTKAAEQGNTDAQYGLGLLYQAQHSVFKDPVLAYMWFNLSASSGHKLSIQHKANMASTMTPVEISQAQELSSLCLASKYTDCLPSTSLLELLRRFF
jgi:hypothetical protein